MFASLYLSEGAPIGFIWLALPTWLRAADVPLTEITSLAAVLVLPWTLKFVWAPAIDVLRGRRWTHKHWILTAQVVMGLALVPLLWLDLSADFGWIVGLLLVHAFAAATQDVAIDALCISVTDPLERGALNGWMQAGMLLGRAAMGGGALILAEHVGYTGVVVALLALTTGSAMLLLGSRPNPSGRPAPAAGAALRAVRRALVDRSTWIGLGFALLGGAAFKGLEVVVGPFLIDRKYTETEIGWFTAVPMIGLMIVGALVGGRLADRMPRRRFVALALLAVAASAVGLAVSDAIAGGVAGAHLFVFLGTTAFGIGLFTAASYALFMDLTRPAIAATQFSAFMGATNGCESWSSEVLGRIASACGYPIGFGAMAVASLLALPLLALLPTAQEPSNDAQA